MGRPKNRRASLSDLSEWDGTDLTEVPVIAATNEQDHSLILTLSDGSRWRVDRNVVDAMFQAVKEHGVLAWRTPNELARAAIGIGFKVLIDNGYTTPQMEAEAKLDAMIAELDREQTYAVKLEVLRDAGRREAADTLERELKGR